MGYTHYFRQKRDLTDAEWNKLAVAVKSLINSVSNEVPVRFEDDSAKAPLIDDELIRFNGVEDDGHETFILTRTKRAKYDYESQDEYDSEGAFNFCKTARKPYDVLVTAILLAAQHITDGAWDVSSDGDMTDWNDGFALVKKVLGIDPLNEFEQIFD